MLKKFFKDNPIKRMLGTSEQNEVYGGDNSDAGQGSITTTSSSSRSPLSMVTNRRVLIDSITKLNPWYLAKQNPVMFTVEAGFFVVLAIAIFPGISTEFISQNQIFYS